MDLSNTIGLFFGIDVTFCGEILALILAIVYGIIVKWIYICTYTCNTCSLWNFYFIIYCIFFMIWVWTTNYGDEVSIFSYVNPTVRTCFSQGIEAASSYLSMALYLCFTVLLCHKTSFHSPLKLYFKLIKTKVHCVGF